MTACDVAVLGAGPYGLSASAHLNTVKGLDVHTFGEPMSFWERNMPVGMLLRSGWAATHIASPNESLSLEAYQSATGDRLTKPVPLNGFIQYGQWYQRQAVPRVDRRKIARIERDADGFRLLLEEGPTMFARLCPDGRHHLR